MEGIDLIRHHVDWISEQQCVQLESLVEAFLAMNEEINLISRKDAEHIWTRHILHSVSIAKAIRFADQSLIADVGTGGGLPGLPLAILFPKCKFILIDSIGKKIRAVSQLVEEAGIQNVQALNQRMEEVDYRFDFVVSRAVKPLPTMAGWLKGKIRKGSKSELGNGLIYIKGGDFQEEVDALKCNFRYWYLDEWFDDAFFDTKKLIWLNLAGR